MRPVRVKLSGQDRIQKSRWKEKNKQLETSDERTLHDLMARQSLALPISLRSSSVGRATHCGATNSKDLHSDEQMQHAAVII